VTAEPGSLTVVIMIFGEGASRSRGRDASSDFDRCLNFLTGCAFQLLMVLVVFDSIGWTIQCVAEGLGDSGCWRAGW
jgi:hypothetical protein